MHRRALLLAVLLPLGPTPAHADPTVDSFEVRACRGSSRHGPYIPGDGSLVHTINPQFKVKLSTNSTHGGGVLDTACDSIPQVGATGGLSNLGLQAAWNFEDMGGAPTTTSDISGAGNTLNISYDKAGSCSFPGQTFGLNNLGTGFDPVDGDCAAGDTLYGGTSSKPVDLKDTDFTVEMWWKKKANACDTSGSCSASSPHLLLTQQCNSLGGGDCLCIQHTSIFGIEVLQFTVGALTITSPVSLGTTRHHLAFRLKAGSMTMTVDGAGVGVVKSPSSMSSTTYSSPAGDGTTYIGGKSNSIDIYCDDAYANGIIDGVRIYTTALSNGTIEAHFKNSHFKLAGDNKMDNDKSGYVCPPTGGGSSGSTVVNDDPTNGGSNWTWEVPASQTHKATGTTSYQFTATDVNENIGFGLFSLTVDQTNMSIPPTPVVFVATPTLFGVGYTSATWVVPTWFCDTDLTSYRYALTDYGNDFTAESYTTTTNSSSTDTVTGLTPNHRYSLTAESKYTDSGTGGSGKTIGFSDVTGQSFLVTRCLPPGDPDPPFVEITGTAVQMKADKENDSFTPPSNPDWTDLSIEGSRDNRATWQVFGGFLPFDSTAPTSTRTASGLSYSSEYEFRHKCRNLIGVVTKPESNGTGKVFITQPAAPLAPTGNAHVDTDTSQNTATIACPKTEILWEWPAVPRGSSHYPYTGTQANYRLRKHGLTSGALSTVATIASPGNTSVAPFYLESSLSPNTNYSRRLDAEDPGATSNFTRSDLSSTGTATTFPLTIPTIDPVRPSAQSPTSVQWDWTRPLGLCPPFQYEVSDAQTGVVLATLGDGYPATTTPRPPPTYTTTFDSQGPLGVNQLVSVRVRTIDNPPGDLGNQGPLSPSATAYTQANPPSLVSALAVTTSTILLSWSGAGNPNYTRFEIGMSNVGFGVSISSPVTIANNHKATTRLLVGLQAATTYYFQVRAKNGRAEDDYGTDFTAEATLAVQTLTLTPTIAATPLSNSTIRYTWSSVPGASGYRLFQDGGGQLFAEQAYGGFADEAVGGPNAPLAARIKAINGQGLGDLSDPALAFSNANSPTGPVVTSVSTNTISYQLGVNGNPGYTYFELNIATDAVFGVVLATRVFTGSTYTADGLFPGTTYFSRVRAISGSQVPTTPFVLVAPTGGKVTDGDPQVSLTTSPASPYSVTSDVVGLWHFDESTGTRALDSSVYGNDGTLTCKPALCTSTPTYTGGPAYLNGAASFTGVPDSLVEVPDAAQYDLPATNNATVSAWAKPATASMPANGGTIVAKGNLNSETFCLDVFNGRYRFRVKPAGGGAVQAVSTQTVRVGQWDHVAGTYNAATGDIKVFVNGTLSSQGNYAGGGKNPAGNSRPLTIGNRSVSGTNYDLGFQGQLDEVRVVDGLLTDNQIHDQYAANYPTFITLPPPNAGVCLDVPPNAFSAPALFYASADPMTHPLHAGVQTLASGLASLPTGQVLVPQTLIEIVPTVGGLPFTDPLGSSVTLCLPYLDSDDDGLVDGTTPPIPVSTLKVYTLDTTVVRWEGLPSTVDPVSRRVFATTPHFSLFALFGANSIGATIDEIRAFPVPWKRGAGGRFDAPKLTFANLPTEGTLRLLTLSGEPVKDILFSGADSGTVLWDGKNEAGRTVASGVYFAYVKSKSGTTRVIKFAIER